MHFAKKHILRSYYETDMLVKYECQTINSMFYELDNNKFLNFEILSNYVGLIIKGLKVFFSLSDYRNIDDIEKVNLINYINITPKFIKIYRKF